MRTCFTEGNKRLQRGKNEQTKIHLYSLMDHFVTFVTFQTDGIKQRPFSPVAGNLNQSVRTGALLITFSRKCIRSDTFPTNEPQAKINGKKKEMRRIIN